MNIIRGLAGPLAAVAVGFSHAYASDFRGFTEFEGRLGSEESTGGIGIMLPFQIDAGRTFFIDLNGSLVSGAAAQGALGAGYRFATGNDWTLGVYGYYDYLNSRLGNSFHQLSFGAEAIGPLFETRANIYLPLGGDHAVDGAGRAVIDNGVVRFREGREQARRGADAEIGIRVPGLTDDVQLKVFGGSYWYDGKNVSDMFGAKLRAELAFANINGLPTGSTVSFGATATYDNQDKLGGAVMARLRIPFGGSGSGASEPFDPTAQAVRRAATIKTHVGAIGAIEDAIFDWNGQSGARVVNLTAGSGDAATINAMLASAGSGAIILTDGDIGLDSSLLLADGQALLGGGGTLALRGASSGGRGIFMNSGAHTTLTGYDPASDVVTMASNSMVSSLAINGGLAGIASANTSRLTIQNVDISNTAHDGIRLASVDGALIENSSIHDLYICDDNTDCEFAIGNPNRAPYAAISTHGTKNLAVRDTSIENVTYGIFAGSIIDQSGWPPVVTDLASNITFDNVAISKSRREGILMVAADNVSMNKLTIDNSAQGRDMDLVVLQGTSNVAITDMSLKGGVNGLMLITASTLPDEAVTTNVKVKGLTIDGTTNAGIFLNPVSGISFEDVTINNAGTYGMFIYGSDFGFLGPVADIALKNVVIDNAQQAGLYIMGPTKDFSGDVTIRNTPRDCSSPIGALTQSAGSVFLVNGQELNGTTFNARCR